LGTSRRVRVWLVVRLMPQDDDEWQGMEVIVLLGSNLVGRFTGRTICLCPSLLNQSKGMHAKFDM